MKTAPIVSVFISYYNDQLFLKESIQSILNQSFTDFELILLNHASVDESEKIAHSFEDKRIVHITMEKNIGAGGSELFLTILHTANGKYLKTFCADDVMEEDCLAELVLALEANENLDFAFSNMSIINECGEAIKNGPDFSQASGKSENSLLKYIFNAISPIPYPTALIKREKIKEEYVERIGVQLFDLRLWCNLLLADCKCKFIDKKLVKYRMHNGQLSGNHLGRNIQNRLAFEEFHLLDLFLENMNFVLAKMVFGADLPDDERFLKFNLCKIALNSQNFSVRTSALHHLFTMLQNDNLRLEIDQKYGIDIATMRNLMTQDKFSMLPQFNVKIYIIQFIKRKIIFFLSKLHLYNIVKKTFNCIKSKNINNI